MRGDSRLRSGRGIGGAARAILGKAKAIPGRAKEMPMLGRERAILGRAILGRAKATLKATPGSGVAARPTL